jgi:lysophospholipase L1-like esterase
MVLVMVAAFLVAGAGPAHAAGNQVYYVALGDSLAAGCASGDYQSSFDHFSGCGGRGYDDQVAESLHSSMPSLQLVNLACGGETTESFTSEPRADCYSRSAPGIPQLADAVAFLEAHPGRIVFITITIGVNDAFEACFNPEAGGLDAACVADVLPGIRSNLTHILETIQAAAPGVPVVGTTYHNPLLGLWVLVENGDQLAHANADAFEVLNSGLASTYEDAGADVADVAGAFEIDNFTDTVVTKEFGEIPVNVANACAWTYFCGRPPSGPFNVHPTTVGYGVIASAVEAALDS